MKTLKNINIRTMVLVFYFFLKVLRWGAGKVREDTATDLLLVLLKLFMRGRNAKDERSNEKTSGSDFVIEFFNNQEKFYVYYQAKVVKFSQHSSAQNRKPIVKLNHKIESVDILDLCLELFGISAFRIFVKNPDFIIRYYNLQIINQFLYCMSHGFFPSYCFYASWSRNDCGTKFKTEYTLTHARTIDIISGLLEENKDFLSQVDFFNIKGLRSYRDEIRPDMDGFFFPDELNDLGKVYSFFTEGWTEQNILSIKEFMTSEVNKFFDRLKSFKENEQEIVKEIKQKYINRIEELVKVESLPKIYKINEVHQSTKSRIVRIRV